MIPHCCPVCAGACLVERANGVCRTYPVETAANDAAPHPCRACSDTGVVWEPPPRGPLDGLREAAVDLDDDERRF